MQGAGDPSGHEGLQGEATAVRHCGETAGLVSAHQGWHRRLTEGRHRGSHMVESWGGGGICCRLCNKTKRLSIVTVMCGGNVVDRLMEC